VIALGLGGAPEGLEAIVGKVGQLQSSSETSHFIAASLALHRHRSPLVAAEPLARLLDESGFAGHAQAAAADTKQGQWTPRDVATTKPDSSLNASLKELLVAGMLVHAGDSQGRGRKILEQYAGGLSGHFARYAQHVLQDNPPGSGGR
jgi:hypothetical protein